MVISKHFPNQAEPLDRPLCENLCTEENSGCDSTTEFCAITATIGVGVGCCQTKLLGGGFCFPFDNGIECQSGICINYIPTFEFAGFTWNFGILNPFSGYCGSMPSVETNTTTITTTTITTTTSTSTSTNTIFQACPVDPTPSDPCDNIIPDCTQLELMTDPAIIAGLCATGLTNCCPRVCMLMGC